ncbi:septation protein SepH [Pseudonocardia dioxanivorans]|uniref:septation protein SepH n=1 Tax=Pseudonocardia dioxanivorans TaxID=240495 RepID=UPI0018F89565|nr:septation protein SepH [Pseudonocardia dioxanivorans]
MRALRVVGITEDGGVVLEDPGRSERFTVPADEQLRAAARGDLTRLGQIAIELESQLRPREIQARIRAGASVEQVAAAAGVPLQKIERFAYPVLLERSRTAEMAQGAHPMRADGPDVRTLGETVAHTFGLRGQDYLEAEWDSWRGEDGRWVVALSWRAGRSDNRAHWTYQPGAHGGTVTALDEHASDLIEGLPLRPLRTVGPVIELGGRPDDEEPLHEPAEPEIVRAAVGAPLRERPIPVAPEPRHDPRPGRPATPEPRRSQETAGRTEPARSTPDLPAERPGSTTARTPEPPERAAVSRPAAGRPAPEPAPVAEPAPAEEPAGAAAPTDTDEPASTEPASTEPASTEPTSTEPTSTGASGDGATSDETISTEVVEAPRTADAEADDAVEAGPDAAPHVAGKAATEQVPDASAVEPAAVDPGADAVSTPPSQAPDDGPGEASGAAAAAAETAPPAEPDGAKADARTEGRPARRTKKGKPVMPSWDEVLLGVRGQR